MNFAIGDRVELIAMDHDPNPITPGSHGTVDYVGPTMPDGTSQLGVAWDSGRALMCILPHDVIRRVTP